jgi:hypothetical protein
MSAVLTRLIRSLALMILIKNLGRHSSAPCPTLEGPSTPGAGHRRPASAGSRSPTPLETVESVDRGHTKGSSTRIGAMEEEDGERRRRRRQRKRGWIRSGGARDEEGYEVRGGWMRTVEVRSLTPTPPVIYKI